MPRTCARATSRRRSTSARRRFTCRRGRPEPRPSPAAEPATVAKQNSEGPFSGGKKESQLGLWAYAWQGTRTRAKGRSMVVSSGIQLQRRVRSWIWLVPLLGLLASLVLAVITLEIDRGTGYDLIPRGLLGSPTAEQQLLSTAATAIFSLSATVITLVLVLVQWRWASSRPGSSGRFSRTDAT